MSARSGVMEQKRVVGRQLFLTRSWLVDVVGAVSIKCQTVTEVFTVVCAWTVG